MWSLVSTENDTIKRILCGRTYTLGRKDADIVIPNDSSVSRKHGTLKVAATSENSSNEHHIIVTDSSKFGTFYSRNEPGNEDHLLFQKVQSKISLKPGDCIRIGLLKSIFSIKYDPLVVITSSMDRTNQAKLKQTVKKLGGQFLSTWQDGITHLVMNGILLNVKVTQALATACPIVTGEYFSQLYQAVEAGSDLPQSKDFLPPIFEQGLDDRECSFAVNIERKSVFRDKTIVFLNDKQMKRLGPPCESAGGSTCLISDPLCSDDMVTQPSTLVISCPGTAGSEIIAEKKIEKLQRKLYRKQLRLIQEHEIGLSLLYCSTEVYCNPAFDLSMDTTFSQRPVPGATFSQVGQQQTEPEIMGSDVTSSVFISRVPETMGSEIPETCCSVDVGSKDDNRKRSRDETCDEMPSKVLKPMSKPLNDIVHSVDKPSCSAFSVAREHLDMESKKQMLGTAHKAENIAQSMLDSSTMSGRKKSKPPPKKKRPNAETPKVLKSNADADKEVTENSVYTAMDPGEMPNPFLKLQKTTKTVVKNTKTSPDLIQVREAKLFISKCDENKAQKSPNFYEIPDSCIDDDSLWVSIADADHKSVKTEYIDDQQNSVDQNSDGYLDPNLVDSHPEYERQHCDTGFNKEPKKQKTIRTKIKQEFGEEKSQLKVKKEKLTGSNEECESGYGELIPDLPHTDLGKVVTISLVVKHGNHVQNEVTSTDKSINYKRFHKVYPAYMTGDSQNNMGETLEPPKIIGGRDLFTHKNKIAKDSKIEDWAMMHEKDDESLNPFG